jgi:hypothetical protein
VRVHAAWVLACFALFACGAPDDGPGTLDVVLEASPADSGAMVVTVSGGPVDQVVGAHGELTHFSDDAGTHVLVTGDLVPGPMFSVHIPEVTNARAYVVTIDQLADGATFALIDPGTARVRIVVP